MVQDLAVYKIIGMLSNLEIAEMCARSGANCGSLFLDLRFREVVKTLLADHPVHLDGMSVCPKRRMLPTHLTGLTFVTFLCRMLSRFLGVFPAQFFGSHEDGVQRRG